MRLPLVIIAALVLLSGPATASFWDRLGLGMDPNGNPQPTHQGSSTDLGLEMDPNG